mgnify:FL=1
MTVLGFCIIFIATTAGSALVFLFKGELSGKLNTLFLGFASGVMVAASVWSLLIPSIEGAEETYGALSFLPAVIGFLLGGAFLVLIDKLVPHFHKGTNEEEGLKSHLNKPAKLFLAVTIHNIPEGLAVGFAFGAAAALGEQGAFVSALGLAVGMAIQNFPEGAAVSLPMKTATGSRSKAFLYGMGSGAVEPVFAVIGYFLAANLTTAQPWFLAFAAGAMIFVVVEDLIPDAHLSEHPHFGTWGAMLGFVVMMALDVALG